MELPRRASLRLIWAIAVCLAGLAFALLLASVNGTARNVDYNQFYSASKLAGTGHAYDWPRLKALESPRTEAVPTARIPVVLYCHKLLSWLPFSIARAVWLALSVIALITALECWPGLAWSGKYQALAWCYPAACGLVYGQDVAFWMMFFALGLLLLQRNSALWAGIVLSLCVCKFHLGLGIPILLLARRQTKALYTGAAAMCIWLTSSFWIEGAAWPLHYREMTSLPDFSPHVNWMPSLWGLTAEWPNAGVWEVLLMLVVAALLWQVCRTAPLSIAGASAAAAGLLMGHHTYIADCALILPLCIVCFIDRRTPMILKVWAGVLLTPLPGILLFSNRSIRGQLLYVGFVAVWLAGTAMQSVWLRKDENAGSLTVSAATEPIAA